LPDGIEFDWDDSNVSHISAHKVSPREFDQVLMNEPLDMEYDMTGDEERYRAVGPTNRGRLLSVVYTLRNGRIRCITAFPAGVADKKAFLDASR